MTKFFLLVLSFFIFFVAKVSAQPAAAMTKMKGLTLSADESDRDTESDTLELKGHVQIIFQDQHLSCETARINFRSKTIDAIGKVLLVGPKANVGGQRIYLDYETNTGVISTGYVQSGNVYFEGKTITKTSEADYIADNAKFTTCTNCPESWSFSGQKIRAELGGYAYIKNSFLRFGGIPFIWLPYLVVPLKSDRQTGLLTPGFEISDEGGLTLSESFFWAMSRSTDSTWTFKNYEFRGLKSLLNYRYALSENSSGELDLGNISDRVFSANKRLNQYRSISEQPETINRWFLKYEHYFEMPEGYVQRMQLNNSSDLQYSKDFPLETKNHGDSAMENRVSLTKNSRDQHYSLDTSYYVNLMQANPIGGNSDAVHRFPELRFSQILSPISDSGLFYKADLNYVNFSRPEFSYDDLTVQNHSDGTRDRYLKSDGPGCDTKDWYNNPNCRRKRDGSYDPKQDIIRTGQRLDFQGSLYRPFKISDAIDILPQMSFRETHYLLNVGEESQNVRKYIRAEISARSLLSKIYGKTGPGSFERYKHEISPEVTYTVIPWIEQPHHPFFGDDQESPFLTQKNISDADINGPFGTQFDYNDRVYDRKLITFALTNRLIQKRWLNGNPDYKQVLSWRLAQSYDFFQAESNITERRREPQSDLLSVLNVDFDFFQIYQKLNYYPYQQVINSSTRIRVKNKNDDYVEVGQTQLSNDISPGQEVDPNKKTDDYSLTIRKNMSYLELLGKIIYDANPNIDKESSRLKSFGYGAQFRLPGNCWYFTLTQYRVTGGDNQINFNFDFIWDGQKKPTLPESLLNDFGF